MNLAYPRWIPTMNKLVTFPAQATEVRTLQHVPFSQIAIAPENVRAREAADAGIPRLADTIIAVGILVPLLVRIGEAKDPKPTMALDGRRRLLALGLLLEQGAITADYPVPVIYSGDRASQVAATVVANDERVPIHIADVIVAIGKLRKRRYDTSAIAAALAYSEVEVRRLGALSALDGHAIEALRAGKLTLRQARLLARLPDKKARAIWPTRPWAATSRTIRSGTFWDRAARTWTIRAWSWSAWSATAPPAGAARAISSARCPTRWAIPRSCRTCGCRGPSR